VSVYKAITWNRERLEQLRAAYNGTTAPTLKQVELEGQGKHDFDRGYAKYLIEYLDGVFAANPNLAAGPNREGEEGQ